MIEIIISALLAGLGVTAVAGPLGSFVVWRRMAYFGDTLAHSSLLGVALGLWLSIKPGIAVTGICLLLAMALVALQNQRSLATDTLLGILSHLSLALGLVAIALIPGARLDLDTLLFGDLLTVTRNEIMAIWLTAGFVLVLLWRYWRSLLAITIHEDLARVEGVPVTRIRTLLMLLLALTIAVTMKVVGVLMVTALLIIPAAAVRRLSRKPEQMVLFASLCGALAVCLGLVGAWLADTPVGPSIVLATGLLFVLVNLLPKSQLDNAG